MFFVVRLFAPYGTFPTQTEYQGIFTTKEKAMERIHYWKGFSIVQGYTAVIHTVKPDETQSENKVFEVQF